MTIIDRFKIEGRTALVTGAGRGLGRAFALALAEAGADVAVVDINGESAAETAGEVRKTGRKTLAVEADVSTDDGAARMMTETVRSFGKLDIAVNNAGLSIPIKPVESTTAGEWQRVFDLNLQGTFNCARAEAEVMKDAGYGKIINIASICGLIVWPEFQALYSVSKAGIVHLTRCLAVEWIKHGIRVNCISPGVTRTPELFEEVIPVYLDKAPIDRIGEVEDLQGAVVYLASGVSDFMVGHNMVIDGGYTLI